MNRFEKIIVKALSLPNISIKKIYKLYRKALNAVNIYFRPFYNLYDLTVSAGGRRIPVRVFEPDIRAGAKVLIFFHGGGWVTGNINTYTKVCANMANRTGRTVISVDYRLAPEHPFPVGLEDCYAVVREAFRRLDVLKCRREDITLIGDSAGGNLAAAVSLMARDRGEFLVDRQILIYPATWNNHAEDSPFESIRENGTDYILTSKRIQDYMELYARTGEDRNNPYFAPLLEKDLSGQPDTLIITAEFDPLRDEGEEYGRRLEAAGNKVFVFRIKDALHGFFSLPWKSENVKKCYDIINCFLDDGLDVDT
ncbi:MAG: alpha/beta hydrolase [Clostridiales bacterium]|nr:alpha/beta hydrolase [Clostridiales bacterium]